MTNWDQECRRVSPDLLGSLPLGYECSALTSQFPLPPCHSPSSVYTNLDRNDDPRLGYITVLHLVPLLPNWYRHFCLMPELAIFLSTPKLWDCPTNDIGLL